MNIKKEWYPRKGIDKLGLINLISHIAFASVGAIWAIYLDSIVHNASYVGFINSTLTIVCILTYFFAIPLIEKTSKTKLYLGSLFLYIISYLLFSELDKIYAVLSVGIILAIASSLKVTSFGIIVRDKTKDCNVSENEGLIYTSINLAWLIGPLVAGFIAEEYGVNKVFLFAAGVVFLALILFQAFGLKDERISKKIDKNSLKVFINFFKSKERFKAYILAGGGNFWWALIYTYIPIYIIQKGLSDMIVGYFLFAITIPLITSEYYFGKLAGKIGFKKIFMIGFSILTAICIYCFFISNIYLLLGMLVLASFGVAMIESTTEAYFLDIITTSERDKYYGPFSTSIDSSSFVATMLGALVLLILPLKYVFLFFGTIMFIFMLISMTIKNIRENKRRH